MTLSMDLRGSLYPDRTSPSTRKVIHACIPPKLGLNYIGWKLYCEKEIGHEENACDDFFHALGQFPFRADG
jgi:hypothetical protein